MKKLSLVFVLGASAFLLTGCGDSYKEISEEEFNSYFSAEKVSAAKEKFAEMKCFNYEVSQTSSEFDYNLYRYLDTDYYYQHALYEVNGKKDFSHDLYIVSSNPDDCKWYAVSSEGENKVTTGERVANEFADQEIIDRRSITRQIDDPFYIAKEYSENVINKQYYAGGKNLKITFESSSDGEYELYGHGIFDKKTLLVSYYEIHLKTSEDSGTVKYKYTYSKSFAHKTPDDIGYKEQ